MRARRRLGVALLVGLLLASARLGDGQIGARVPIDHIVVLFLENRSFDHLFGTYPGAEGLASYRGQQADKTGVTYARLPAPLGRDGKPDPRFPGNLPNAPFAILRFVGPFDQTNNPVHRFYHMQRQYGAGADGVPMGLPRSRYEKTIGWRVWESPRCGALPVEGICPPQPAVT